MQISGNPRSKLLLGLAVLGQRVKVKAASFAGDVLTSASFGGIPVRLGVLSSLVPISAEVSRALSRLGVFQDTLYVEADTQAYILKQGVFANTSLIKATTVGRKVSLSSEVLQNTLYITGNTVGLPSKYADFSDVVLVSEGGSGIKAAWGTATDTTLVSGIIVKKWLHYNSCLVSTRVLANTLSSDIQLESYLESRVVLCPKESC